MALAATAATAVRAQGRPLEAERAFALTVRGLDDRTIEVAYAVAGGYYLYRDKLKLAVEGAALGAPPVLPAGKVVQDAFFGKVEIYPGPVSVRLPLAKPAPGATVTVVAESQGCSESFGICYPPNVQRVALTLPAAGAGPGPVVEASPARKPWFK